MGETEKKPNVTSLTKQLSGFVSWKITWLSSATRESQVKATLANLRRGVGKVPGELPEIWGVLFQNFPQALSEKASEIEPSKAEWASYLALTLYALHQQGNDIERENMQRDELVLERQFENWFQKERQRKIAVFLVVLRRLRHLLILRNLHTI